MWEPKCAYLTATANTYPIHGALLFICTLRMYCKSFPLFRINTIQLRVFEIILIHLLPITNNWISFIHSLDVGCCDWIKRVSRNRHMLRGAYQIEVLYFLTQNIGNKKMQAKKNEWMNEFTAPLRHPQGILCWLCVLIVCRGRCRGQIHWNGVSCKYKTIGDVRLHNWMRKKEKNQRINMYLHFKKNWKMRNKLSSSCAGSPQTTVRFAGNVVNLRITRMFAVSRMHVIIHVGSRYLCSGTRSMYILRVCVVDTYYTLYDALYGNTRCIQIHLNDGRWK